jgi:hypothetical protein
MKRTVVIVVLLFTASVCSYGQDKEQVITLLHDIDERRAKYEYEIIHIEEFNFGIPGGGNWLVEWKDKEGYIIPFMYAVDFDAKEIKFSEQVGGGAWRENVNFPISWYYERFPGVTRGGNGRYQIGDFNDDGFDEIAHFFSGASSPEFYIYGYDPQEGKKKYYCNLPWLSVDYSSPVEFIMYKGLQGFQIYYNPYGDTGVGQWFFYIWDGGRREFINLGVVNPEYIGVETMPVQIQDAPVPPPAAAVEEPPAEAAVIAAEQPEETVLPVVGDGGKFVFIIVLIGGVVLVAGLIIFFVVRKKKA